MSASERQRLASAFRRAYEAEGISQEALSEATATRQATISKYARGETTPPLSFLSDVEEALGKPRGYILRLADYVSDDLDIAAAIATDPSLDDLGREVVLRVYAYCQAAERSELAEQLPRMKTKAELEAEGRAIGAKVVEARRRKRS